MTRELGSVSCRLRTKDGMHKLKVTNDRVVAPPSPTPLNDDAHAAHTAHRGSWHYGTLSHAFANLTNENFRINNIQNAVHQTILCVRLTNHLVVAGCK